MRIINDNDTRTFTDAAGDSLTLLLAVRHRDVLKRDELESGAALEQMKAIGIDYKEAMRLRREATPEELAAAEAKNSEGKEEYEPATRRFMLQAVAVRLTVRGEDIGGNAILEAYDKMDPESAAWVDAQVDAIWSGAVPSDAERER